MSSLEEILKLMFRKKAKDLIQAHVKGDCGGFPKSYVRYMSARGYIDNNCRFTKSFVLTLVEAALLMVYLQKPEPDVRLYLRDVFNNIKRLLEA